MRMIRSCEESKNCRHVGTVSIIYFERHVAHLATARRFLEDLMLVRAAVVRAVKRELC